MASSAGSFAAFVEVHSDSLFRTAYLLTGNAGAAEELVQEVLVRLYPRWDRVTDADQPVAYVRRSLVNAFVSSRRRASSRDVALAERHDVAGSRDLATGVADRELVWQLLSALVPRQRAALVLRYFHDLPDPEIAAALGCRVATVRSLISRGVRELQRRRPGIDPDHDSPRAARSPVPRRTTR